MVPQLSYLLLAQDDAPPHVVKPFLLYQWGPILQVNAAVWRWTSEGALIGSRVIRDWILRKVKGGSYGVKYVCLDENGTILNSSLFLAG